MRADWTRWCLLAVLAVGLQACIGYYRYVVYMPFRSAREATTQPAWLTEAPTRKFVEVGMFEGYSRHMVFRGRAREPLREDILEQAAARGCDAVVEVPAPQEGSSSRTKCGNLPDLVRVVCIQYE